MIAWHGLYWKKANIRRIALMVVLAAAFIATSPFLLFGYLYLGYRIALHQWISNSYDTRKPINRNEFEANLYLTRKTQVKSFRELEVSRKYKWNPMSGIYEGWNNNDYQPSSNDSYVSYKILGVAPIDAVFNADDRVVLLFQSFDH